MSHDWPFMVITVRQLIHMRRRLRYTSFTKIISSSPACKVGYFRNLHREWQTLAAISCVWSNFRIPRNSFTCHWIRIASIVLCLDLQSLPTHVSEAEMSCGVFWSLALCFARAWMYPCAWIRDLRVLFSSG